MPLHKPLPHRAQPREAQLEAFERQGAASDAWLARVLECHLLADGAA
ncbi:MAG: hypothetical protein ACREJ5_17670 [Geminicoccaceae bacterium]